jgi:hypothetical protein
VTPEGARGVASAGGRPAPMLAAGAGQAFSVVLARVRGAAPRLPPPARGVPTLVGAPAAATSIAAALSRSRRGYDGSELLLRERRDEADPSCPGGGASRPPPDVAPLRGTDAPPRLFAPAALENVALALSRDARPSIEVRLANGTGVRLTRGAGGIELVLEVAPGARRSAEAELPALDAALRARGVIVASAEVRSSARSPGGGATGRALTGRRPSDTTASRSSGTVAKW